MSHNALVAKLDCFDEAWIVSPDKSFWHSLRRNALGRARNSIIQDDPNNVTAMLSRLQGAASNARHYRGSLCGTETVLAYQLEFYALVKRCLELDPLSREDILVIACKERAEEIIDFVHGKTIR